MHYKLFVITVLLAAAFSGFLRAQDAAGPKIVAKELSFDFGNVVQGSDVSHVFEIRNAGSTELVIEQVQSS